MAPAKDKWIRRFIIPETARHKKGFTIYKVTSMVFLNSSHEEISKVSVWKRYNDFKKLHSELSNLHKHLGIKESFPTFPKSRYFGRFEAEVVEERRKYALKFLEFIGQYSYLYSSDIFITFFETSHVDNCNSDCAHSISSDTSEDDRIVALNNSVLTDDTIAQSTFQVPYLSKTSNNVLTNTYSTLSNICTNENECAVSHRKSESHSTTNLQKASITRDEENNKMTKQYIQDTTNQDCDVHIRNTNLDRNHKVTLHDESGFDCLNNNISKNLSNCNTAHSTYSMTQADSAQYILIAAGHMSAAFKHESIAEYKEAFTQYKLGISSLITGVQLDPDSTRVANIKEKISKYLAQAEQLYNKHLNCNISLISKPVSELQYYKILKIMKSVMLATDMRINCSRIIKSIEKSSVHEDNINNYVLRERVPYMVELYSCVETETAVFLILQYANCGRLWDFIKLRYKPPNNLILNHICTNNYVNKLDSNENTHELKKTDKVIESDISQGKDHICSIDEQNEIYSMEVPTVQLLEKSQKLLQSVNATLRRSNSIASRLNKSKELRYSGNASSLNAKIIAQISRDSDLKRNNDIGSTSVDTNALNINCTINVNNHLTSNNDRNIYETQYPHLYKENNADDDQELWQVPETVVRSWAAEILLALEVLHQQGVFIFDFKPDNILIDDMGHVQLTYIIPQHNVELSKLTYPYSSPESATFSPTIFVTSATDIWSFGVILYELLTGITFAVKHPGLFHSHSAISIPSKLSENARTLLYGILKYHPDERLTISEIKRHPFFAVIDWSSMVNS
ncbi:ribosomal protein S6 kinase delta-1 [Harpegnathos saltator]|uniref:Ribosomal protein S6 kinase-like 1 n=1 Tax=Harpegnathos saltator TaxID=610380 RepID=E2BG59_HARSA|nr:ribosomal protein S6 kinase delta-1 [Harpegnathos saltator]EFN85327.1 Ribosomal protein S6 kinase-like 1 [Harpegnathos saltator]